MATSSIDAPRTGGEQKPTGPTSKQATSSSTTRTPGEALSPPSSGDVWADLCRRGIARVAPGPANRIAATAEQQVRRAQQPRRPDLDRHVTRRELRRMLAAMEDRAASRIIALAEELARLQSRDGRP